MKWMKTVLFALGALAAALSSGSALGDDLLERAISLTSEKRYSEARGVLNQLLEDKPGDSHARLLHGILRAREGRVDEAIDVFEALRRDHPDMSEPYNNLAVLYAVQGRLDDARQTLMVALERGPDAVVYANLGDVYMKLAQRAYRRARELAPDDEPGGRSIDTTFPAPTIPAGPSGADSTGIDSTMESTDSEIRRREPTVGSRAPGTALEDSTRQSPSAVAAAGEPSLEGRGTVAEQRDDVSESTAVAAGTRGPVPMSPGEPAAASQVGGTPVSSVASAKPAFFCARTGGFKERRDVADAALWLQSYGAQVVEVRHEEHQVARSHRVYLPPFASRKEAAAKLREIQGRGVRDVALINDGALANGISFGVYSRADNMRRRVSALDKLGYRVQSGAADIDIVEEYVIKARAEGTLADLVAAWPPRFAGHSFRFVDCR